MAEKPSFREAVKARRCLVPADGFYEWRMEDGRKQPFRIGMKGGVPFAFAGLWERWTVTATGAGLTEGETVETVTIVTIVANEKLLPIHARMPVIIGRDSYADWLAADTPAEELAELLRPAPEDLLDAHAVSRRVNSPLHDEPELIEPAPG